MAYIFANIGIVNLFKFSHSAEYFIVVLFCVLWLPITHAVEYIFTCELAIWILTLGGAFSNFFLIFSIVIFLFLTDL